MKESIWDLTPDSFERQEPNTKASNAEVVKATVMATGVGAVVVAAAPIALGIFTLAAPIALAHIWENTKK